MRIARRKQKGEQWRFAAGMLHIYRAHVLRQLKELFSHLRKAAPTIPSEWRLITVYIWSVHPSSFSFALDAMRVGSEHNWLFNWQIEKFIFNA